MISFLALVIFVKESLYVLDALSAPVLTCPLNTTFIVVEYDGQQNIHKEKDTKDDKCDEEKSVPGRGIVGLEHDVWKVGRCNKHNQLVISIANGIKIAVSFKSALDYKIANRCEVPNI